MADRAFLAGYPRYVYIVFAGTSYIAATELLIYPCGRRINVDRTHIILPKIYFVQNNKYLHRAGHGMAICHVSRLRLRLRQCLFNQNRYRYHIRFTKNITIYNNHIFLIYNESNARWETSIKVISDRWHGGHPKRNSMHTQWENT